MKNKKQIIRVQPTHRYYQPKYPSYLDKNPLKYPDSRPYPFSLKMIQALGAAGFAGALLLTPTGCRTSHRIPAPKHDTLYNTFPFSASNLPYTPVTYGTGLPSRLPKEKILPVLDSAFILEGLTFSKDTLLYIDGIRIKANAYNKKYNIGYIWMDYYNYGKGMAKKTRFSIFRKPKKHKALIEDYKKNIDQYYDRYIKNPNKFYKETFNRKDNFEKQMRTTVENKLKSLGTEEKKKQYFKQWAPVFWLTRRINYNKERFDSPEISLWLDSVTNMIDNELDALVFVDKMHLLFQYIKSANTTARPAILNEIRQINNTRDPKTWRKRGEALLDLLRINGYPYYPINDVTYFKMLADIIDNQPWTNRRKGKRKLKKYLDYYHISLSEAHKIDSAAQDGEFFIAPISVRDSRTVYQPNPFFSVVDEKEIELMKKFRNATSQEEKDSIQVLLNREWEVRQQVQAAKVEETKQKALKKLEDDVRTYIRWAKAQQGY